MGSQSKPANQISKISCLCARQKYLAPTKEECVRAILEDFRCQHWASTYIHTYSQTHASACTQKHIHLSHIEKDSLSVNSWPAQCEALQITTLFVSNTDQVNHFWNPSTQLMCGHFP